jgi:exosortase
VTFALSFLNNKPQSGSFGWKALVMPALVFAAVLIGLYAWLPYSMGYGDARVTILWFAKWVWSGGEDWQHCYLVPLAVGWMIYADRRRLLQLPVGSAWTGLVVTVFGLIVYWAGYRVDNVYIGYASFQILTAGLILWLLGWQWMMALAFPWMFLVFLYPLPFLDNMIAFPLRMTMSNSAVAVLDLIGIDVVRQGTGILSAPDVMLGIPAGKKFSVDVADPCSGIRSLFALMMVSALYGHFSLKSWWQKGLLFLSSIPLAVVGNLVRILILTLGTIIFGSEFAIGKDALNDPSWFHMAAGYAVFAVAISGMLGIAWLLNNAGKVRTKSKSLIQMARESSAAGSGSLSPATEPGTRASQPAKPVVTDEY